MGRRRARSAVSVSLFSFQDIITCLSGIMILLVLLISLDIITRKLPDDLLLQERQSPPPLSPPLSDVSAMSSMALKPVVSESFHALQSFEQELQGMREALRRGDEPDPVKIAGIIVEMEYAERHIVEQTGKLKGNLKEEIKKLQEQHLRIEERETELQTEEIRLNSRLTALQKRYDALSRDKSITLIPEKGSSQKALPVECSGDIIRWGGMKQNSDPDTFATDADGLKQFLGSLEKVSKTGEYLLFMIKPSASDYAMQLITQVQQMGFDVGYDAMVEEHYLTFGRRAKPGAQSGEEGKKSKEGKESRLPSGTGEKTP